MRLDVKNAICGYVGKPIIKNISISIEDGDILCILGPNGVGKTTFFRTLLGFLKLQGGAILVNGDNMLRWSQRRTAKVIGYVPQHHSPPFPFTVIDTVVMGRTAHMGVFSSPTKSDYSMAEETLNTLGILHLKDAISTEISGGERQMVLIARALVQQPEILVMDEPTSNLDFANQVRVLKQIRLLSEKGLGVIMTTHLPDHAFLCSTKAILLQKNDTFTSGAIDDVITEVNLKQAYGIDVRVISAMDKNGCQIKTCVPLLY